MTYDFSTRLDRLGIRMKDLHDNSLNYVRGNETPLTINNFTPERIDVSELAAFGITIIGEVAWDFVFDFADLADLDPQEPQKGDRIAVGNNTYEVMMLGEELFNFTTSTRKRIRVHTKQII